MMKTVGFGEMEVIMKAVGFGEMKMIIQPVGLWTYRVRVQKILRLESHQLHCLVVSALHSEFSILYSNSVYSYTCLALVLIDDAAVLHASLGARHEGRDNLRPQEFCYNRI